jgi:hypothetical protein
MEHRQKLKVFVAVGALGLITAGLVFGPGLWRGMDSKKVWGMRVPLLNKATEAVARGDILKAEWLMDVVRTLEFEATLVRSGPAERPPAQELAQIKEKIDLKGYNSTLRQHLSAAEYNGLHELRVKYGLVQYFEPGTE